MQLNDRQTNTAILLIDWCKCNGFDENSTTAIVGNAFSESALYLNNVQNSYENKVGTDTEYTDKVNNNKITKDEFIHDGAGYGLFQWTFYTRKARMYDYSKQTAKNIETWDVAKCMLDSELLPLKNQINGKDIFNASAFMVRTYLQPHDQSDDVVRQRAKYGVEIMLYLKCCVNTTETIIYEDEHFKIIKKGDF